MLVPLPPEKFSAVIASGFAAVAVTTLPLPTTPGIGHASHSTLPALADVSSAVFATIAASKMDATFSGVPDGKMGRRSTVTASGDAGVYAPSTWTSSSTDPPTPSGTTRESLFANRLAAPKDTDASAGCGDPGALYGVTVSNVFTTRPAAFSRSGCSRPRLVALYVPPKELSQIAPLPTWHAGHVTARMLLMVGAGTPSARRPAFPLIRRFARLGVLRIVGVFVFDVVFMGQASGADSTLSAAVKKHWRRQALRASVLGELSGFDVSQSPAAARQFGGTALHAASKFGHPWCREPAFQRKSIRQSRAGAGKDGQPGNVPCKSGIISRRRENVSA